MTKWTKTLTVLLFVANPVGCEEPPAVEPQGHEAKPQAEESAAAQTEPEPVEERWNIEASHTVSPESVTIEIRTRAQTRVSIEEDTTSLFEGTTDAEGHLSHTLTPTSGPHKFVVRAFDGESPRVQTRVSFEFSPPAYALDSVQIINPATKPERRIQLACEGELASQYGESVSACPGELALTKTGRLRLEVRADAGATFTLGGVQTPFDAEGVAYVDAPILELLGPLPLTALESPKLSLPAHLKTAGRSFRGHLVLEREPLSALFIESLYKPHRFPRSEKGDEDGIALLFIHQSQKLWKASAPKGSTIADVDRLAFAVETRVNNRRCRYKTHVRDRYRQDLYVVIYELRKRSAKLIAEEEIKATNLPCPEYPWDDDGPIVSTVDPARAVQWVGSYAGKFY